MIEAAIRSVVLGLPAVAALGASMGPAPPPQGVGTLGGPSLPVITFQRISNPSSMTLDGTPNPGRIRLQIDCWAAGDDHDGARALALAVKGGGQKSAKPGLNGFAGMVLGERLRGVFLVDERDFYESDVLLRRVSMDFIVHAEEGVAA